MKVRMMFQISGTRDGERWPVVGECMVVSDAEGAELCAQGYAEPVAEVAKVEKATARKVEKRG